MKTKYNKLSVRKYLEKYVRDQKPWYNIHCKEEYIQVTIPPYPVNEEIETDEKMSERQVEQVINEIKGYMVNNILFIKISCISTTIIFLVSSLVGMVSHKK